jgi:fused signal recognition particle receptor
VGFFRSLVDTFKKGLEKTRSVLVDGVQGLRNLLTGRRLDEALISEIETRLLHADVGVKTTKVLIDGIRADFRSGKMETGDQALDYMKREIKAMWPNADRTLHLAPRGEGPTVILVTGVNGAGKTTSIAKLCRHFRDQNQTVLLGACDTFRAGAVAQLEVWAQRLGVQVVKGQQGGDPAAVAFDACAAAKSRGVDILILDTAGRLQTQDPLMRQLGKIRNVAAKQIPGAPQEVLLVLDATAGQNALRQAEEFSKHAGVSGIFLTKLDGTAKGGIVVAIREVTEIPVKFIGTGERPEDAAPFDPDAFVEAMFATE